MKLSPRLLPLLAVLALAGCGGGHHKAAKPSTQQTIAGHACTPADTAMQCVLATQPPPSPKLGAAPGSLYGVDFAWGGPRSCSQMHALGAKFAWSYWSYDTSGKNWTKALVDEFHRCGILTAGGWETSATRAAQGFAAGVSDAHAAAAQAAAVGNTDGAIVFAIDFDANGPEVLPYFQGVHSVLGARGNAYGGYHPLLYLFQHGAVGHFNFQTYAWSGGAWLPPSIAPLEQYLNGNTFDNDRAIASNFGQWPAPAPPGPSPAQIRAWQTARNTNLAVYHKLGCKFSVLDAPYKCRLAGVYVLSAVRSLDAAHVQATPQCWGKQANLTAAACVIERPNVSAWSRARQASANALDRLGCNGPVSFPAPVHSKICDPIRGRRDYFNGRIRAALKEF